MLRVLAVVLAAHGYRTDVAENGQEGLAAAATPPAGRHHGRLGAAGSERHRGHQEPARVDAHPLIVLSGSTAGADQVAALDAGADDYIAKPLDAAELLARLRAVLRRASRVDTASRVRIGSRIVDIARRTVTAPQGEVSLTPTEWEVL